MSTLRHRPSPARLAPLVLLAAAACADGPALSTPAVAPRALAELHCTADVRGGAVSCADAAPAGGARRTLTLGGQHVFVRLASSGAAYDTASRRFGMDVTLQNLLAQPMGTPDGTAATGSRVWFASLAATEGSGVVEVANADGEELFLSGGAPFFRYPEILAPRGTSAPRRWEFAVPPAVARFTFRVYVETELPAEEGVLRWQTVEGGGNAAPGTALTGVWAGGPRDVWVTGAAGTLLHFDGTSWAAVPSPDAERNPLYDVWGAGAREVYAAGSRVVLRYDGNRWSEVFRDAGAAFNDVSGTATGAVYAVGRVTVDGRTDGAILRLAGGGAADVDTLPGPARASDGRRMRQLWGVAAEGATALAVGSQFNGTAYTQEGVVLRSVDGGASWSTWVSPGPVFQACGGCAPDSNRDLADVALHGGVAYAVGSQMTGGGVTDGVILRSADGGATWTETLSPGPLNPSPNRSRRLGEVVVAASGEVLVFGTQLSASGANEDVVLRSVDGGATWSASSPTALTQVVDASPVGDEVWAVGSPAAVVRLSGGAWSQAQTATAADELAGVWSGDAGSVVAVGSRRDGDNADGWVRRWDGTSWSSTLLPGPVYYNTGARRRSLRDVAGAGSRVLAVGTQADGTATGYSEGVLLLSADGGRSWSATRSPGPLINCFGGCYTSNRELRGAAVADPATLYAAGHQYGGTDAVDAVVLRSADGGASWTATVSPGPTRACGTGCTRRLRQLMGIATGSGGRVYAVGYQTDAAGAYHGVVLRSADAGASWSEATTPPTAGQQRHLLGVRAWGADSVVVVGRDLDPATGASVGVVLRSGDGGATWTAARVRSTAAPQTALRRVWGAGGAHLHAAGDDGVLLRSRDGGATWHDQASGTARHLLGIGGASAGDVVVVGAGGAILRGTR